MPHAALSPRDSLIKPGDPAPDFTLPDQDRQDWSLAEHLTTGDVVLCFFPFAFTSVCATEMECLSKEIARWSAQGATPVGVSCDSFAALKAWAQRDGYTHTMLSDLHRSVCRAYGLYWNDLNVAQRGTVIISKATDGTPTVKWAQAREPGSGMDLDQVLAELA